jgi:hypothetical protein
MTSDNELRRRFVNALDEVIPPAPALEARVLESLRREERQGRALRPGPRSNSATPGAGMHRHLRALDSDSIRAPRFMALVAALLAFAIVVSMAFAARALHLRSSVPAHSGHQFVRLWSRSIDNGLDKSTAFTSDGFVLIVDQESGRIIKLNASDGRERMRWGSLGDGPGQFNLLIGIAVDAENNVYATDYYGGKVVKFDENGKFLRQWSTELPTIGPFGIGVDAADRIYVAVRRDHDHHMEVFTPDGVLLAEYGRTGTGDGEFAPNGANYDQTGPNQIVVEPDGKVWVSDDGSGRLYHFASDGRLLLQAGAGTQLSTGHRFGNVLPGFDGHVYAAAAELHEFDASGHDLGIFDAKDVGLPDHPGYYPQPIADPSGKYLYVWDRVDSTLTKFLRQ